MSSLSHPKYQRQRIIQYSQNHSVTETALRYGMSRKTVYKWLARYDGTLSSLEDRSHRPRTSPKRGCQGQVVFPVGISSLSLTFLLR